MRMPAPRSRQGRSKPKRSVSSSSSFASDRRELLNLLLGDGILRESATQPVLSRDGTSAPWMLDSLGVTLSSRGAELAGRCLLHLLQNFEGRQLATFGTTGIPILQSCVLLSQGKYRGLLVRKERKAHGSRKLIEGKLNPAEPVVIIDDSVSSGISMDECVTRLEQAGLRVEGGVCLVRFGYDGGFARMRARGYQMHALYDIWDDFMANMPDETPLALNPTKAFPAIPLSKAKAPEGLHPSELARRVITEALRTGTLLRPPKRIQGRYDGDGGVWVSLRPRDDIHQRYARTGFWHFPGEKVPPLPEALAQAAFLAGQELSKVTSDPVAALERSAIAVTFFSELEECGVGQLDNDRHGIVVRSRERPYLMGGALPRMPGIAHEWQQFDHARTNNARLLPGEPFILYRHEVQKAVEPGAEWQSSGVRVEGAVPWFDACAPIAERAFEVVRDVEAGRSPSTAALGVQLDSTVDSLYLSIYRQGVLRGCMGTRVTRLENDLVTLAQAALADSRFQREESEGHLAVTVSLLHSPTELGEQTPEEIVDRTRHAEQALMAYQGQHAGLLLPSVAVTDNLSPRAYAYAVLDKAGITQAPYQWCRFDCTTWLADSAGARRVEHGLPAGVAPRSLAEGVKRLAPLMCQFLLRHLGETARYEPFADVVYQGLDTARLAHQAWTLARAHRLVGSAPLGEGASKLLASLTQDPVTDSSGRLWIRAAEGPSIAEVSFVLLALLETGENRALAARLASTLWSCIDVHGRVTCFPDPAADDDVFQDYFPGQALLALALAAEKKLFAPDKARLAQARRFYRHRFRHKRHWGQVSWLAQAAAGWWRVDRDAEAARFAFEICDWALAYQSEKSGAFLNDHQSDTPGYTTALYLEALGAAARLAESLRERPRRQRYLDALARGVAFLDALVIQERDGALLPNLGWALGGVRASLVQSEVRVDFVQHALLALLATRP